MSLRFKKVAAGNLCRENPMSNPAIEYSQNSTKFSKKNIVDDTSKVKLNHATTREISICVFPCFKGRKIKGAYT